MARPVISVVMPARNEADRVKGTIRSFVEGRTRDIDLEFVIADDASDDGCCTNLALDAPRLRFPQVSIKVVRLNCRQGVPRARNQGARRASGEILFITDAHTQVSPGWDRIIFDHLSQNRILAATTTDPASAFHGYGCRLAVPFMGTYWNREKPPGVMLVQIAACHGTVLKNELFRKIGGYDFGMLYYAAAEPEFSVRAWLTGAEILQVPDLEVKHRFRQKDERTKFLNDLRPFMIHNSLRFGILYMSERAILQMIRYFSLKFPNQTQKALAMVTVSDVWRRRAHLRQTLRHDFDWYVRKFSIKDDIGREILR
jgi:glycosyltransferase involved in cell wall biosynthesis